MRDSISQPVARREFLKRTSQAAAGTLLAGCSAKAVGRDAIKKMPVE